MRERQTHGEKSDSLPDAVFAEKVEFDDVVTDGLDSIVQLEMLHTQRAAANGIGLVFILFVAHTESELQCT